MSEVTRRYSPNCEIKPGMKLPDGVSRWALVVEYQGSTFQGFQRQISAKITVQGELEKALSAVANVPITLVCAGRTDAGVHATQQVIHFDTPVSRPEKAWIEGVNTQLPPTVRVHKALAVAGEFHARFSAQTRTYRYLTYMSRVRSAIMANAVTWSRVSLDIARMEDAAQVLVGEHDFSAFRASQCQAQSPIRRVNYIRFIRCDKLAVMEIQSNAFLHHMVRNIMGSLFEVGRGVKAKSWLEQVLAGRDRRLAAATASPCGLYLAGVDYPPSLGVHLPAKGPIFVDELIDLVNPNVLSQVDSTYR